MTSTTMLACSTCWNPIGSGARAVRLGVLVFHPICAPKCRDCQRPLSEDDEQRWASDGEVVWRQAGDSLNPTKLTCGSCHAIHEWSAVFARP